MRATTRLLLTLTLLTAACGHKPPYSRAQKPSAETLLATTAPQLPALAISDANVTVNRWYRADLEMLAEAPNRLRAKLSKKGTELMELGFHEEGYAFRNKFDAVPMGFYHGPPDPCAVEVVLQVPLSYEGLVALVLGGAPILPKPYEVLDQRWDRRNGYEELVIGNAQFVEELRFAYTGGQWRFTGAAMWRREPDGDKGGKVWDLLHDKFGRVGDAILPGRTRIAAPGKRRDSLVLINYSGRDPNPPWASDGASDPGPDGSDTGGDDTGWDDNGWDDGDERDEGWEDGEAPTDEAAPVPAEGVEAAPAEGETSPPEPPKAELAQPAPTPAPAPTTKSSVPEVFIVEGTGLTDRGDLCR